MLILAETPKTLIYKDCNFNRQSDSLVYSYNITPLVLLKSYIYEMMSFL